jgi:hypothetical protein
VRRIEGARATSRYGGYEVLASLLMLGPNGSLYPWIAPFVLALVGAALLATGTYLGGVVLVVAAVLVRWLHQVAIDRGEYP